MFSAVRACGVVIVTFGTEGTYWYLLVLLFATVPTVPACLGKEYSSTGIRKQPLILAVFSFCLPNTGTLRHPPSFFRGAVRTG